MIKFDYKIEGNRLYIHKQSIELTNLNGIGIALFTASDGCEIRSCNRPEIRLEYDKIYIKGNKNSSSVIFPEMHKARIIKVLNEFKKEVNTEFKLPDKLFQLEI